jgi:hypothetical protein
MRFGASWQEQLQGSGVNVPTFRVDGILVDEDVEGMRSFLEGAEELNC